MNKILACFVVLSQVVLYASAQCSTTCAPSQTLDYKSCSCIPTVNCAIIGRDDVSCRDAKCDTLAEKAACPSKCYCERPSAMTNCCAPCLNGGSLNLTTCDCGCKASFQGPQCQYPTNKTLAVDDALCSMVDCSKATTAEFFGCPNKCLACENQKCDNLGSVNPDCTCSCLNANYDAANECARIACVDDARCPQRQIRDPATNALVCADIRVKLLCPVGCKQC